MVHQLQKKKSHKHNVMVVFLVFLFAWVEIILFLIKTAPQYNSHEGREELDQPTKYDTIVLQLEAVSLRYYMYDKKNPNDTAIWNINEAYHQSRGEYNIILALERHALRTLDPHEAHLFIVPFIWDPNHQMNRFQTNQAFQALISHDIYLGTNKGERHVVMAFMSHFFNHFALGPYTKWFNSVWAKPHLAKMIVVKDVDHNQIKNIYRQNAGGDYQRQFGQIAQPISNHTFSTGIVPGVDLPLLLASYEKFNQSTWTYFYHTRLEPSANGATKFRHAPLHVMENNNNANDRIFNTSSIGMDIDLNLWKERYGDSKFCLCIRGDDPQSRSFLRSVRLGCLPVVVSNLLPQYTASFSSTLDIHDFAFFIEELYFISNPTEALRMFIQNTTQQEIRDKIQGLQFAQRVIMPDHPQSLFVPAFLKEAWKTLPGHMQKMGLEKRKGMKL